MGITSFWHWIILLLVVVLVFGQGKISGLMGDLAKGIKAFKSGLAEDPEPQAAGNKPLELQAQKDQAAFEAGTVGSGERKAG
jgi:sec-independent protein translocase protein TatA